MKIGIVGTGTVGCACAMAAVNRGSARQIVLVNRTRKPAEAVAVVGREAASSAGAEARVLSTGTFLDTMRFRVHLGRYFDFDPAHVDAQVIGDHGTSQVFLWSSARAGGVPLNALLEKRGETLKALREKIEKDVRYANITIIEGHGASQYGIGIVSARIAEMILHDERAVVPIGSYQEEFGVTLSLPSVVGRGGVTAILPPQLSDEERQALQKSANNLKAALERVKHRH